MRRKKGSREERRGLGIKTRLQRSVAVTAVASKRASVKRRLVGGGLWRKSSGDDGEKEWTAVTVMTARIGEDWMVAIVMQITTTQLDWIVSHSHCAVHRKKTQKRKESGGG